MNVPGTRKMISSYDVVFDEKKSIALAYTSQPYAEAMAMRTAMSYTPNATSSREKTGDIITFTQFEEGNLLSEIHNLLSETRDDTERGNESDDNSMTQPLITEEKWMWCFQAISLMLNLRLRRC